MLEYDLKEAFAVPWEKRTGEPSDARQKFPCESVLAT
jgi:hypothetical protein